MIRGAECGGYFISTRPERSVADKLSFAVCHITTVSSSSPHAPATIGVIAEVGR